MMRATTPQLQVGEKASLEADRVVAQGKLDRTNFSFQLQLVIVLSSPPGSALPRSDSGGDPSSYPSTVAAPTTKNRQALRLPQIVTLEADYAP